jgi:hypothetical protein
MNREGERAARGGTGRLEIRIGLGLEIQISTNSLMKTEE